MVGRITSTARACNAHGVPFERILESERISSARVIRAHRAALEAYRDALALPPNSAKRRRALETAKALSERALS